jgi:hypothetical protein
MSSTRSNELDGCRSLAVKIKEANAGTVLSYDGESLSGTYWSCFRPKTLLLRC